MIVVSYLTAAPPPAQIQGLTYGTVSDEQKRETRRQLVALDVVASCVVLAAILAAYVYFSG